MWSISFVGLGALCRGVLQREGSHSRVFSIGIGCVIGAMTMFFGVSGV
jgi:hypothetical protein